MTKTQFWVTNSVLGSKIAVQQITQTSYPFWVAQSKRPFSLAPSASPARWAHQCRTEAESSPSSNSGGKGKRSRDLPPVRRPATPTVGLLTEMPAVERAAPPAREVNSLLKEITQEQEEEAVGGRAHLRLELPSQVVVLLLGAAVALHELSGATASGVELGAWARPQ